MARSVAELLPRRFDELTLEDVAAIISAIGAERETLFFERKAEVNGNALAKVCSAFANTYGGLLVGGVADDDDTLVGMEPLGAAEPQLWVKDTLRNRVLPMPPFRSRWLPTEGDRGLLLVLVEESASTPHILTRSGVIYVRSPGSSDPVPLADQRTLLELTARGEEARSRARRAIQSSMRLRLETHVEPVETLVLAATGIHSEYEPSLFNRSAPELLSRCAWGDLASPHDYRRAVWRQGYVGVERYERSNFSPLRGNQVSAVLATRDGAVALYRAEHFPDGENPDRTEHLTEVEQRGWFERSLSVARDVLLELGAHGDALLLYRLDPQGRGFWFESRRNAGARALSDVLTIELSTTLEDEALGDRVFDEVARAVGLGPADR